MNSLDNGSVELIRFVRAIVITCILGCFFVEGTDNLADFSARATREGIAFQKEMMHTQLQRLFAPHEHEEE